MIVKIRDKYPSTGSHASRGVTSTLVTINNLDDARQGTRIARRKWRSLAVAIVSVGAIGALTFADASASGSTGRGDGSDRDRGNVETIVLIAQGDQFTDRATMDLGVPGLSQGDRFVFNDNLLRDGTHVGIDGGECGIVHKGAAPEAATYQCVFTLSLPAGQITAQGLFTEQTVNGFDQQVFAVTGGTGHYHNTRGDLLDQRLSATSFRYTLRLTTSD